MEGPPLAVFFGLTFLLAWTLWYAATLLGGDSPNQFLILPGTFAPGIVAVLLTARAEGASGVRPLLAPLFDPDLDRHPGTIGRGGRLAGLCPAPHGHPARPGAREPDPRGDLEHRRKFVADDAAARRGQQHQGHRAVGSAPRSLGTTIS